MTRVINQSRNITINIQLLVDTYLTVNSEQRGIIKRWYDDNRNRIAPGYLVCCARSVPWAAVQGRRSGDACAGTRLRKRDTFVEQTPLSRSLGYTSLNSGHRVLLLLSHLHAQFIRSPSFCGPHAKIAVLKLW